MTQELDKKTLRDIISEKAKSIRNKILKTEKVEPGEYEEITRLDQVIKIYEGSKPKGNGRLFTIVLLAIIVVAVTASLFIKKKSTQVQMNLITTRLEFCLEDEIMIADGILVQELGIGELSKIDFPRSMNLENMKKVNSDNGSFAVKICGSGEGVQKGAITLNNMYVPQKTRIMLSSNDVENQYRLHLEVPETERLVINASIQGNVALHHSGKSFDINSDIPKSLVLHSATNKVDIDLVPFKNSLVTFLPVPSANDLSFCHEETINFKDKKVTISDLISGTLNISTIKNEGYKFHNKEILQFKKIYGKIRSLQLSDDKIMLNFQGKAEGITTDMNQSLMPSWLEFVSTHHRLKLIWASVIFLFGLGRAGLNWITRR
jgi:hypothetical protein